MAVVCRTPETQERRITGKRSRPGKAIPAILPCCDHLLLATFSLAAAEYYCYRTLNAGRLYPIHISLLSPYGFPDLHGQ